MLGTPVGGDPGAATRAENPFFFFKGKVNFRNFVLNFVLGLRANFFFPSGGRPAGQTEQALRALMSTEVGRAGPSGKL